MSPDEERYPRPTPPHPQRAPLLLVVFTSHPPYILWVDTYAAQRARFRKRGGRRAGMSGSPHPTPSGALATPSDAGKPLTCSALVVIMSGEVSSHLAELYSIEGWGQVGQVLIFDRGPHGTYTRPYRIPYQPRTALQVAWRTVFAAGGASWFSLPLFDRQGWEARSRGVKMTGENLFLRHWLHEH